MKQFHPEESDKPIEEYEGYIGMSWDWDFFPGPELKLISDFDWELYWDSFRENEDIRKITVNCATASIDVEIEYYSGVAHVFDQLKSIEVMRDEGPDDPGPASGSGYIYFLAENTNVTELRRDIQSLRKALDDDLIKLISNK